MPIAWGLFAWQTYSSLLWWLKGTMEITSLKIILRATFVILSLFFILCSGGHIVATGSIAGHESYEGGAVYCASKHALHAFMKALRYEVLTLC